MIDPPEQNTPLTGIRYQTLLNPSDALLQPLQRGLDQFNRAAIGDYQYARLAVVVQNAEQLVIGGVYGDLLWDWLYINTLWLHPDARGYRIGTALMDQIERAAIARGITKAHLETTSFQALGFYQRRGYTVFGTLEGKPAGTTWYYLKHEQIGG